MTDPRTIAAGLTQAHFDILDRLARGLKLGLADRADDKRRQRLRKAGLIAHCGRPKRWQISSAGLAVRAILESDHEPE